MTCEYLVDAMHWGVVWVCEDVAGFLALLLASQSYFATTLTLGLITVCLYYQQAMTRSVTQTVYKHTVWLV